MLFALALLGALPLAFLFDGADDSDDDRDKASSEDMPSAVPSEGADDLLSHAVGDVASTSNEDEEDESRQFDLHANGEDTTFSDFNVGEDEVTLHLADEGEGEFSLDMMLGENGENTGVSLSYFDGDIETVINFLGLSEIPLEDIFIAMTSNGGEETLVGLGEIDEFSAIIENDPEAEEIAHGVEGLDEEVVGVNDSEAAEVATAAEDLDGEVLMPNLPPGADVMFVYEAESGDGENDKVAFDMTLVGSDITYITNFEAGVDILQVTANMKAASGADLDVKIELTGDGGSSQIVVDGAIVAVITGTTDITLDDILIEFAA